MQTASLGPQTGLRQGQLLVEAHHDVEALDRLPSTSFDKIVERRKTNHAARASRYRAERKTNFYVIAAGNTGHFGRPFSRNPDERLIPPAIIPELIELVLGYRRWELCKAGGENPPGKRRRYRNELQRDIASTRPFQRLHDFRSVLMSERTIGSDVYRSQRVVSGQARVGSTARRARRCHGLDWTDQLFRPCQRQQTQGDRRGEAPRAGDQCRSGDGVPVQLRQSVNEFSFAQDLRGRML